LRDIIDHNVRLRVAEADKATEIIDAGVEEFVLWRRSRGATDLVVSYRNNIEALRDEELERALQLLQAGKSAEEVLTGLARALTQKIMHQPTVEMRNAAGLKNISLLESAKKLFGLESMTSQADGAELKNSAEKNNSKA
jgi:glutamyl-tRNA reductase